jgi:hypothetical protein
LTRKQILLAVHLHGDHAAAGSGVDLICAISCCIFSCICCAWRIICCMLPGSFTYLLLQVSNSADFAAEDFAEALNFRVGQRAAGGFILRCGRRCDGLRMARPDCPRSL